MIATRQAPPTVIPLRFVLFGVACAVAASAWLLVEPGTVTGPYYRPHTVALAHLVVLGCAMSVCMGAMYPLVPVALAVPLFSVRMALPHTVLHLLGVCALVPAFFAWEMRGVAVGGGLVFGGAVLFSCNMAATLVRVARPNAVGAFVAAAIGWMLAAMALGVAMVASKFHPLLPGDPQRWLPAHAHIGILGIFINLILGVSFRLVPMFTLAEWREGPRAWSILGLVNVGLAVLVASLLAGWHPGIRIAGIAVAAGLCLYGAELFKILRGRRRSQFDPGMITFLGGLTMLVPTVALGLLSAGLGDAGAGPRVRLAYPFAALFGVVLPAIVGMAYKILPFLVWHKVYGPRVGREPVPVFGDMVSPALQAGAALLLLVGFAALVAGILDGMVIPVAGGAAAWLCGMLCFSGNVALVMRHWFRRGAAAGKGAVR